MKNITEPKFKKGDIVEVEIVPGSGPTGEFYDAIFEVVEVMGLVYKKDTKLNYPLRTISIKNVIDNYSDRFHSWIVRFKFVEGEYNPDRYTPHIKRNWYDSINESFVRFSLKQIRESKIDKLLMK